MNFDESKTGGWNAKLARLVGEWSGATKTWFEPGVLADESPMTGKIHRYSMVGSFATNIADGLQHYS
ncbi:MAG: DUF1579 family protein [Pyrinomonadaceae bacterium]